MILKKLQIREELFKAFFSASDPLGLCLMRPHRVCDYLADSRAEEADRSQAPLTSDCLAGGRIVVTWSSGWSSRL